MALVPLGNSSMAYRSYAEVRAIGVCGVCRRYSFPSALCCQACARGRYHFAELVVCRSNHRSTGCPRPHCLPWPWSCPK